MLVRPIPTVEQLAKALDVPVDEILKLPKVDIGELVMDLAEQSEYVEYLFDAGLTYRRA